MPSILEDKSPIEKLENEQDRLNGIDNATFYDLDLNTTIKTGDATHDTKPELHISVTNAADQARADLLRELYQREIKYEQLQIARIRDTGTIILTPIPPHND